VGELKHLSSLTREINRDSRSSGERTGRSPNHPYFGMGGVVGLAQRAKDHLKALERATTAGESPVEDGFSNGPAS
jgi:hypothetical protein